MGNYQNTHSKVWIIQEDIDLRYSSKKAEMFAISLKNNVTQEIICIVYYHRRKS